MHQNGNRKWLRRPWDLSDNVPFKHVLALATEIYDKRNSSIMMLRTYFKKRKFGELHLCIFGSFLCCRRFSSTRQTDESAVKSAGEPLSIKPGKGASALFEHHPVAMEMGNQLPCLRAGHRWEGWGHRESYRKAFVKTGSKTNRR